MPNTWTVKELSENVFEVEFPDFRRSSDWIQEALITGDRHIDNPMSNIDLQLHHLLQAQEKGAPVLDNGDLLCVMQGKSDKRHSKGDVRPEHQKSNYLDAIVNETATLLSPFADQFAVFGDGNHEQSVRKRLETDLTGRLVERLQDKYHSPCKRGSYMYFVRFKFRQGSYTQSIDAMFFHGSGGGGPVTKGVIQTNRRNAWVSSAQIIVTGHIHELWQMWNSRLEINQQGQPVFIERLHLQHSTYKDEFRVDKGATWHMQRGADPRPIGGWWLQFRWDPYHKRIVFDALRAR